MPSVFLTDAGCIELCWEDSSGKAVQVEFRPAEIEFYVEAKQLEDSVPASQAKELARHLAAPANGCADAAVVAANCSRESLIAFITGQTGTTNPQRQGLNAALFDGHSPLNILKEIPERTAQFDYSPLWDIHLVHWNDSVPVADRLRQTDFATAQALVGTMAQSVTPGGLSNTFQATGFIVNCPVVSLDVNPNR